MLFQEGKYTPDNPPQKSFPITTSSDNIPIMHNAAAS
jgi:hypothetical protein